MSRSRSHNANLLSKAFAVLVLCASAGAGCNIALPTQESPREPLDAIWERHMLEGRGVRVWLDEAWKPAPENEGLSVLGLGEKLGKPSDPMSSFAVADLYGINVLRHVEGYWRNGGWHLAGGLLGRAIEARFTFDLYGKAVIRRFVHVPAGILHLDPPTEVSYEFFLIRRIASSTGGTILRRWTFRPDDVIRQRDGYPRVEGKLTYDRPARVVTVSITGVKQPIEEHLNVSAPEGSSG